MEQDVDVSQIVVDLPVSETLVKQKMQSLAEVGLIQPLAVWQSKMLIIDGFHRLEAAKRLGWQTVRCSLLDVSEEQFWTSRIDSAKQHHEIENERLASWITQCWQASNQPDDILDVMWKLYKKLSRNGLETKSKHLHLSDSEQETLQWFKDHAARWNMMFEDVFDAVATKLVLPGKSAERSNDRYHVFCAAVEGDLDTSELIRLGRETDQKSIGFKKGDISPEGLRRFTRIGMPSGQLRAIDNDMKVREQSIARDEMLERHAKWETERLNSIVPNTSFDLEHRIDALTAFCNQKAKYLAASQNAQKDIVEFIAFLTTFAAQTWPEEGSWEKARDVLLTEQQKLAEVNVAVKRSMVMSETDLR